jgi:bifunctional DNA-binding transcriptional regulator/antitoxin component of YhaV-PrlF toxin-antitoxin module
MPIATSVVTVDNRIPIPMAVQERLGIRPGSWVILEFVNGRWLLRRDGAPRKDSVVLVVAKRGKPLPIRKRR